TIYGGSSDGGSVLRGDAGDDTIYASGSYNTVTGGDGNDRLYTDDTGGINTLNGEAGGDYLVAGAGRKNYFDGGVGNDSIIWGAGRRVGLAGGAGDDLFVLLPAAYKPIDGGDGFDEVDYGGSGPVFVNLVDQTLNDGSAAGPRYQSIEAFRLSASDDS